jgi:pimeloyl-ACP methyl ester carboxylesterase
MPSAPGSQIVKFGVTARVARSRIAQPRTMAYRGKEVMRPLLRIAATILLACLVALVVAAPGWAAQNGSKETIRWHSCGSDSPRSLQCGELAVPLDYSDPDGAKIRLGFNRLRAQDRAHRIGSLIVNQGGPGGAGSEIVAAEAGRGGLWHPSLHRRFDLIGMDPRGIGTSTPVRCDPDVYNRRVSLFPRNPAQFGRLARYVRDLGQSCRERTGRLLGHVDTASVVRDMEALRRALGDGRLNFLGLSYGAEIGALYAERYPTRIRAMALDGILDHSIATEALFTDNAMGYEDAFTRFAAWCAQTAECALHGRDVVALFEGLTQRADQQPIPVPECAPARCHTPVTGDDIRVTTYNALLFKDPVPALGAPGWNALAQALGALEAGDASPFARPLVHSSRDDTVAGLAVNCVDYPRIIGGWDDLFATTLLARTVAPHTQGASEAWLAVVGCMRWPVPVANRPHRLRVHNAPPILLVNATHDPSTPYRWAYNVVQQIPRAVLLTRDGDGHTSSFLRQSRTNDAIAQYLITRRPPAPNTVLPD